MDINEVCELEMSKDDAVCPILSLAPAEYTYWEKRVWRRGVVDAESRREVQQAIRDSQDGKEDRHD